MNNPMTKLEIDNYFKINYNNLVRELTKKFPKCKETITEDLSDCYIYMLTKPVYKIRALIFMYIYNKHHRFYKKKIRFIDFDVLQVQYTEEEFNPLPEKVKESIATLPLDLQKLYSLYYEQGLSSRTIGNYLNISHTSVCSLVKTLQEKVKNYIEKT